MNQERIFEIKGGGFLSFARNMGKNVGKNISKNLSSKYSQKLLDRAKQFARDALKMTSKTLYAAGDLIVNRIADIIIKVTKL